MNTTFEVVIDLWPLYVAGEASADTRAMIEEFLAGHPDLARRLRDESSDEILKPKAVTLPPGHEAATLLKTQRRRAFQSMLVNSAALLISLAMTTLYLWKVVPPWVATFQGANLALPGPTRFMIAASNWAARLAVPAAIAGGLLVLFRKRFRIPEIVKSGTALAIVTGLVLLLTQLGWLAFMVQSSRVVADAYKVAAPAMQINNAVLAMRAGNYRRAGKELGVAMFWQAKSGNPDPRLAVSLSLFGGDVWTKLGYKVNARASYEQALRDVHSARLHDAGFDNPAELEKAIREALADVER